MCDKVVERELEKEERTLQGDQTERGEIHVVVFPCKTICNLMSHVSMHVRHCQHNNTCSMSCTTCAHTCVYVYMIVNDVLVSRSAMMCYVYNP